MFFFLRSLCGVFVFRLVFRAFSFSSCVAPPLTQLHPSCLTQCKQLISHNSSPLTTYITHLTQLISHNSSHTTHLTQLISLNSSHTTQLTQELLSCGIWWSCFRVLSLNFTQVLSHNSSHNSHNSYHTTPPRPCPRLCSRCSASDDRRSRCSAFVCFVCRGTWTLLSPPLLIYFVLRVYTMLSCMLTCTNNSVCLLRHFAGSRLLLNRVEKKSAAATSWPQVFSCFQGSLNTGKATSPPAPAQDYIQGAVLLMTGDQGAVLLCAEEHERFCPPPPLPKTMFKVQCFWRQAIKVQCFCVQRNMNAFVSPPTPQPNPKWLSQVMW